MTKCPFNNKSQQGCPWFCQGCCTFFTNIQIQTLSGKEECFFEQSEHNSMTETTTLKKDCINCLHWDHCKNEYKSMQVCGDYKSQKEYEYEIIKRFAAKLKERDGVPMNTVDNLVEKYNENKKGSV